MQTNRGAPTPPIAFGAGEIRDHLQTPRIEVDDATRAALRATGADVTDTSETVAEASRDWWPLAMIWALDAQVAARARRSWSRRTTPPRCKPCSGCATRPASP